jgi:hypothetical protein
VCIFPFGKIKQTTFPLKPISIHDTPTIYPFVPPPSPTPSRVPGTTNKMHSMLKPPNCELPWDVPDVVTYHVPAPLDIGEHDMSFTEHSARQLHNDICSRNQFLIAWVLDQHLKDGVEPGLGLPRVFLTQKVVSGQGLRRTFLDPEDEMPYHYVQPGARPDTAMHPSDHHLHSLPPTPKKSLKRGRDSPPPTDPATEGAECPLLSPVFRGRLHFESTPSTHIIFPCALSCGRLFGSLRENKAHACKKSRGLVVGKLAIEQCFPCRIKECTGRFFTVKDRHRHENEVHLRKGVDSRTSRPLFV